MAHAAGLTRTTPPSILVTTRGAGASSSKRCSSLPAAVWESTLMTSATIMRVPAAASGQMRPTSGNFPDGSRRGRYGAVPMHASAPGSQNTPTGAAPVSVHFVNNVLAAAASYIEVEPDTARDVLAGLGAFLSHRLRPARIVPLAQELDHRAVYLKLEQFRFPGRLEAELPPADSLPERDCVPGAVQAPLADALGRWLGGRRGRGAPGARG